MPLSCKIRFSKLNPVLCGLVSSASQTIVFSFLSGNLQHLHIWAAHFIQCPDQCDSFRLQWIHLNDLIMTSSWCSQTSCFIHDLTDVFLNAGVHLRYFTFVYLLLWLVTHLINAIMCIYNVNYSVQLPGRFFRRAYWWSKWVKVINPSSVHIISFHYSM